MNLIFGLLIGIVGNTLVVAGGIAAYRDNFFFPEQMKAKGIPQGFPYVIHGAMWSDLLLISPLLAAIVTGYAGQWSTYEWLIAGVAGLIITLLLHFLVYLKGPPGFWGYGGKLTLSGWFHLIYTAYALAIIGLFNFATISIDHMFLITTGIILALHIVFAQIGQLLAWKYKVEWFQDKSYKYIEIYLTTAIVWGLIAWRCYELWPL